MDMEVAGDRFGCLHAQERERWWVCWSNKTYFGIDDEMELTIISQVVLTGVSFV